MPTYTDDMNSPSADPARGYHRPDSIGLPDWAIPAGIAGTALLGYGALRGVGKGLSRLTGGFRKGFLSQQAPNRAKALAEGYGVAQHSPQINWIDRGAEAAKASMGV